MTAFAVTLQYVPCCTSTQIFRPHGNTRQPRLHVCMWDIPCTSCWQWNFIVDVFSDQEAVISDRRVVLLTSADKVTRSWRRGTSTLMMSTHTGIITAAARDAVNGTGSQVRRQTDCCRRYRLVAWIKIGRRGHWQVVADHIVEVDAAVVVVVQLWRLLSGIVNPRITVGAHCRDTRTTARLGHWASAWWRRPGTIWTSYNLCVQVSSCIDNASVGSRPAHCSQTDTTTAHSSCISLCRHRPVPWDHSVDSTGIGDLYCRRRWRHYLIKVWSIYKVIHNSWQSVEFLQ